MTEYTLGEICELKTGIVFKDNYYTQSGFPVLRARNIKNGILVLDDLKFCNPNNFLNPALINPGNILIVCKGDGSGRVGFNNTDQKFLINQTIVRVLPDSKRINERFLFQFLSSSPTQSWLKAALKGGVKRNLNLSDLKKLKIKLPPLAVQKEIASQLDKFMSMGMAGVLREELSLRRQQYEYYRNLLVNPPVENFLTC